MYKNKNNTDGFTLIEILLVVVILTIASLTAIPMLSSGAGMQIRSAANMIASDMEYARSMAISRGQNYEVVFNPSAESYSIEDSDGNVIDHPVNVGSPYTVNFQTNRSLNRVEIESTTLDFDSVVFDCLGSPESITSSKVINLSAGDMTATVTIEPVTGYISISL